jgi:hypothetical protein
MPEKNNTKLGKLHVTGSSTGEGESKIIELKVYSSDYSIRYLTVYKEKKDLYKDPEYVFNIRAGWFSNLPLQKVSAGDIGALVESDDYKGLAKALLVTARDTMHTIVKNDTFALGAFNEGASGVDVKEADAPMRMARISKNANNIRKHLESARTEEYNLASLVERANKESKSIAQILHLSKRKS